MSTNIETQSVKRVGFLSRMIAPFFLKDASPKAYIGLMLWSTAPLLVALGVNLWTREPYQHFPFVWLIAYILWWLRVQKPVPDLGAGKSWSLMLWALAAIILLVALAIWSPWMGGFAFVLLLAGWSFHQQGRHALKESLPVLLLFLVTLPPPLRLDETLLLKLKEIAVTLSSRFLDLRGVVHTRAGSIIELPRESLLVEQACSGINSFLSLMAAGLFIVIFERRRWWHAGIVLGFTVIMVVALNVMRIVGGTVLKVDHDIDLLRGSAHEWTGLVTFLLAILAVWSFDRFVAFFSENSLIRISTVVAGQIHEVKQRKRQTGNGLESKWQILPGTLLAFLLIAGCAGFVRGGLRMWKPSGLVTGTGLEEQVAPVDFKLPPEIQGWQESKEVPREKAAEVQGRHSQSWHFTKNGIIVSVAIDYPFPDFHDVTGCYVSAGWKTEKKQPYNAFGGSGLPASRLGFTKSPLMRAEVLSSNFINPAHWIDPVKELEQEKPASLLSGKFWQGARETGLAPPQFRVQTLWSGITPLLPADRKEIDMLFDIIRQELARQTRPETQP